MKRIDVKGFIIPQEDKWIYDWLEYPYTCSEDVNKYLREANGDDIEVYVNSYGGAVHVGSEIYTSLKDYKGNVLIKIVGLAASAASVVCMSAKCIMTPPGQIMIHNASTSSHGDYRAMDKTSEMLKTVNKSILNAYKLKTGLSENEIKEIMDKETWLTAEDAKELGFVDEIMFEGDDGVKSAKNSISPVIYNSLPIPSIKAIEELRMHGSVENFKASISDKQMQTSLTNIIKNEEGEDTMNLSELKEKYPEIYNQAVEEGTKSERERIRNIESVAPSGFENLVKSAKFENAITAEKLAMNIIQAQKEQGQNYLNNVEEDAKELEGIEGSPEQSNKILEKDKIENTSGLISGFFKKKGRDRQ